MSHQRQLLWLLSLALVSVITAQGQSGRRSTGGSKTTTTAPSVSEPKPVEKKPTAEPQLQLLVGINGSSAFMSVPFHLHDTVLGECVRRLGEAEIVFARSAGNRMNRGDAAKTAKLETTRWVVVLEIVSIYADTGRQVNIEQDELAVEYTVIEPGTGKTKRVGRTQQHIYKGSRDRISIPPTRPGDYSEYSIIQTAREAADRILAGFDIKVPGNPRR